MTLPTSPSQIIKKAFPGIGEEEARQMERSGQVCSYPALTELCRENTPGDIFYVILEGEVQVSKQIDDREQRVLKFLQPGDFFGEMALLQDAPRAATVITTVRTTCLEIHKDAFHDMLQGNTVVSLAMVREASRRLRENDEMAIEDLRTKARELAVAYQQLAEADIARREFLTIIAHELRTPLTAASGFMQMVRLGLVHGEALNSALETVSRHIQEIVSLVNDILFLQEMELILLDFQPTDIGAVVASAVEQYRSQANHNRVGLNLSIAPNIPVIPADAKSLERAIQAILDNAIKFSPEGGDVRVDVCSDGTQVMVIVQDRGIGIPPEIMPRIFDRFFRMEETSERIFRGLGLGLSIARQVIEQHHGRIEVQSEVGKGSTFTVIL